MKLFVYSFQSVGSVWTMLLNMANQICRFCLVNRLWNFMPSKNKRIGDLVYNGHYYWFTTFCLVQVVAAGGIGFTIFGNKYY